MAPRDQRKTELLEATLRVIAGGGVDAVRARRVAAEAQVPLGSISYWFDGREDLIRAAFVHFLQSNTGFLEGLLASCPVSTQADLVDLLVTMGRITGFHENIKQWGLKLFFFESNSKMLRSLTYLLPK